MRLCLLVFVVGCSSGTGTERVEDPAPTALEPSVLPPAELGPLSLNYRANGRSIELQRGTEFSVELAAPAGGEEHEQYEGGIPKAGGALSYTGVETRKEGDRRYWTFRFRVGDKKSGKLRINRHYPGGSSDPAPDFGLHVIVTNNSKNE